MDKAAKDLLKTAMASLEDAKNNISSIGEEARDKLDDMTEKQQEGDTGQKLSELIDRLDDIDTGLDQVIGDLGDVINEK